MRVAVTELHVGLHPNEVIVCVGGEFFPLFWRSIQNGSVEIGYPVGARGQERLVEMPVESQTGTWRVWVPKEALSS